MLPVIGDFRLVVEQPLEERRWIAVVRLAGCVDQVAFVGGHGQLVGDLGRVGTD